MLLTMFLLALAKASPRMTMTFLPVYDCASISSRSLSPNAAMPYSYRRQQHGQALSPSPPMDLVRQLVRKYGGMYDSAKPWDRNHEDLPEWDPSLGGHRYNAMQQQPVLPSPLSQARGSPAGKSRGPGPKSRRRIPAAGTRSWAW
jgi:hypothetical protein